MLFFIHSAVYRLNCASLDPVGNVSFGWRTAPELGWKKDYFHNLASLETKQLLLVTARYSRMNPRCIYHSLPPLGAVVRFSCSLCEPRMRRRCIHVLLGKSMLFVRSLLVKPLRLMYCFVFLVIVCKHNTYILVV